jgi:hypothetical protein
VGTKLSYAFNLILGFDLLSDTSTLPRLGLADDELDGRANLGGVAFLQL